MNHFIALIEQPMHEDLNLFWGVDLCTLVVQECTCMGFDVIFLYDKRNGGRWIPTGSNDKAASFVRDSVQNDDRLVLLRAQAAIANTRAFANAITADFDKSTQENTGLFCTMKGSDAEHLAAFFANPVTAVDQAQGLYNLLNPVDCQQVKDGIRSKKVSVLIESGVTIEDPLHTYIEHDVIIKKGTVIRPGCEIRGNTTIEQGACIGPDVCLKDVQIGENTQIIKSVIHESVVGNDCTIGPFCYIRPGSVLADHVKAGDFVEIKNANIGKDTKIPHHAYIGDADVGQNTNIACGVITANYDGKSKHRTHIGNGVFVGCNVSMVAPVRIHDGAYVAAGSTIINDVPADSLAIARERQVVKENWVIKKGLQRE